MLSSLARCCKHVQKPFFFFFDKLGWALTLFALMQLQSFWAFASAYSGIKKKRFSQTNRSQNQLQNSHGYLVLLLQFATPNNTRTALTLLFPHCLFLYSCLCNSGILKVSDPWSPPSWSTGSHSLCPELTLSRMIHLGKEFLTDLSCNSCLLSCECLSGSCAVVLSKLAC